MKIRTPLVSAKRLGEILDVKEKTIYDWARKGKVPSYHLHGLLRFNVREVVRHLEGGRGQS